MKRVIGLSVALILGPTVSFADWVTVHTDATLSSCNLSSGVTGTATVAHKFSIGATSARFRLELPDGSTFLQFNTPWSVTGSPTTDVTVGYGQCMMGSWVVGTITAVLTPGVLWVKPAIGFTKVMTKDCELVEHEASCCGAYVDQADPYCPCCETVATEQRTWGQVKSLYR